MQWVHYNSIEPIGDDRADYRAASIVQMLYNVNRGKNDKPGKLEEFLLKWAEADEVKKTKQTPQQQLAMLKILAAMHANDDGPRSTAPQAEDTGPVVTFADPTLQEQAALVLARKAMRPS